MGAGAGSSIVVGVFCGCLSLVVLALGSWSSSFLLSPLPFVVITVPPAFHPEQLLVGLGAGDVSFVTVGGHGGALVLVSVVVICLRGV
jgi:hypothetical protein